MRCCFQENIKFIHIFKLTCNFHFNIWTIQLYMIESEKQALIQEVVEN